jgi:putative nucleotidyltransferase with HDIG domain
VYIRDSAESSEWYLYTKEISSREGKEPGPAIIPLAISEKDLDPLKRYREYIVLRRDDELPSYLQQLSSQGMAMFLILPIMVKEGLFAFIVLAERHAREHSYDHIIHARQIADRMAVAFANASLMDEMNQLNWGTLTALARVVDAKSSWTAGHSERVADLAVRIGKVIGLQEKDLVTLNKAGLLHDIGKVRTPRQILNKPEKLTEEELDIIRKHPEDSSRILEPITPYRDIIPAVLQHHERFDGKGYPRGLSGGSISLCGRILAVADSFDAMVSDRPYRKGKSLDAVLREIREEAGKQFDPRVVDALMQVLRPKEE